ncbi:MAG: serine hydroxymethyltransferase [candidate division Zixibacteria bacterium]|nr:serine hydroxymethyltransferase [candidate division Zixibacteria bacterium]
MQDFVAIKGVDIELYDFMIGERKRQREGIELIPSENYVSSAVLEAMGSILTNKYSEGYPGKRYYGGQEYIDRVENLARQRAKELFGAEHVNVQPYSGSPANIAVMFGLLSYGDTIMGMRLDQGGHLTHGLGVNFSGKSYNVVSYGVRRDNGRIDMDEVRQIALQHRPKLVISGATAYPRLFDFEAFKTIADEVGAIAMADISHISGLVVAGVHPSPLPFTDVVTTTTHKTLRGPRSAIIMCKEQYAKDIDRAVFPGLQGGPHDHTTAAKAIAFKEAMKPEFKDYARQIVANAKALADELLACGFDLVSGGTDNHLVLVDLTHKGVIGKDAETALDKAGLTVNKNSVPYDTRSPFSPSGIRLGTPAATTRGMKEPEMRRVARWIERAISHPSDDARLAAIHDEVREMCAGFPVPGIG